MMSVREEVSGVGGVMRVVLTWVREMIGLLTIVTRVRAELETRHVTWLHEWVHGGCHLESADAV